MDVLCGMQKQGQFATHLHAAVISQDLNALKQLNHKGADLSAKNSVRLLHTNTFLPWLHNCHCYHMAS